MLITELPLRPHCHKWAKSRGDVPVPSWSSRAHRWAAGLCCVPATGTRDGSPPDKRTQTGLSGPASPQTRPHSLQQPDRTRTLREDTKQSQVLSRTRDVPRKSG